MLYIQETKAIYRLPIKKNKLYFNYLPHIVSIVADCTNFICKQSKPECCA
jgi:hypothetical protein